jgi:hypothetical protein
MSSLLPRWYKPWNYSHLTKDDPLLEKVQDEEDQVIRPQRISWWQSKTVLWISNLLFASLSLYLFLSQRGQRTVSSSLGSFEQGFTTEIAAARSEISLEYRNFYGTPTWTKDGVGSLLLNPKEPRYVGEANDELDDNWKDFIGGKLDHAMLRRTPHSDLFKCYLFPWPSFRIHYRVGC